MSINHIIKNVGQFEVGKIIGDIYKKKSIFWEEEKEKNALRIFHLASQKVPAYKDFLRKNKVNPQKIKSFKDFQQVPFTSKNNYLKQYPLEKLTWEGSLKDSLVFSATSGSTGESFYFPRKDQLDWEYSVLAEIFIRNNPLSVKGPTLIIDCLGMGVWIAGVLNYQSFKMVGQRGYPLSILTPGINKVEIFKALKKLAPNFRQTILLGYPPFLKDIVDEAACEEIDLKKLNLRFLSGAESYTERFREYLVKKSGAKNLYLDTLNIYGTADIGSMAFETPTSILIRRLIMKNEELFQKVFSQTLKTPTLAQYNPYFITFEAPQDRVILTGDTATPLIRYDVGDNGGVCSFEETEGYLKDFGIDIYKEAKKAGIKDNIYQLPFVYVYERADLSTTLYGLNIYPETIKEALLDKNLSRFLTGKFSMSTQFDNNQNQCLEIHIEKNRNCKPAGKLEIMLLEKIVEALKNKNSEYRELHSHLKNRAHPKIKLWDYESAPHFKPGGKQKWVIK